MRALAATSRCSASCRSGRAGANPRAGRRGSPVRAGGARGAAVEVAGQNVPGGRPSITARALWRDPGRGQGGELGTGAGFFGFGLAQIVFREGAGGEALAEEVRVSPRVDRVRWATFPGHRRRGGRSTAGRPRGQGKAYRLPRRLGGEEVGLAASLARRYFPQRSIS